MANRVKDTLAAVSDKSILANVLSLDGEMAIHIGLKCLGNVCQCFIKVRVRVISCLSLISCSLFELVTKWH